MVSKLVLLILKDELWDPSFLGAPYLRYIQYFATVNEQSYFLINFNGMFSSQVS